jgi:hypothetical protein
MDLKYNHHTLQKVEEILKSNNYFLRYEKGRFNSGYCIVHDKKVIIINRFFDIEARIHCLLEIIQQVVIDIELFDDPRLEKFYHSILSPQKT